MTLFGLTVSTIVFWLIIALIMLIVEALTAGLTTIWFAGGAFAALVCALLDLPIAVQIVIFFIVSILFSTRLPYKLLERIRNSVFVPILLLAIFSASIYCMYKGFDDPFLYFRF